MSKSGKSDLSPEQAGDARRAKALYEIWRKKKKGNTQIAIAARYFDGSEDTVWQYLNGWRPLNEDAAHALSLAFGVAMSEISPTLAKQFNSKVSAQRITLKRRNTGSPPEPLAVQTFTARIKGVANMSDAGSWQWTEMLPGEGAVLWNRPGRYALRITGDATHPRYKSGEYIIVAEDAEQEPDSDVLVLLKDGTALIRELASIREGRFALRAIRGGDRRTVNQDQIAFIHRIVGRADASEVLDA